MSIVLSNQRNLCMWTGLHHEPGCRADAQGVYDDCLILSVCVNMKNLNDLNRNPTADAAQWLKHQ